MTWYKAASIGCCLLLLSSCSTSSPSVETSDTVDLKVSGAKVGSYTATDLLLEYTRVGVTRPSAPLGTYASLFLSQGIFLPVQAALAGIESQQKILAGQLNVETSETFALLKEFGAILQVDIIDTLNRSQNRQQALDTYLRSLDNIIKLADRKLTELEARADTLDEEHDVARDMVREQTRALNDAIDEQNYELAGTIQEELNEANKIEAEIEIDQAQVNDIIDTYEELLDVGKKRLTAIVENRRVILAGLKVVDVPGIDEFNLVEEPGRSSRRRSNRDDDDSSINPFIMFGQ